MHPSDALGSATSLSMHDKDLLDRGAYMEAATPSRHSASRTATPSEFEEGALAEGGAIALCSREAMGLFSQYAAIGVIYGMIPALNYPIFNVYLNMEGYQTASYSILVAVGWSYKVVFGILSDCFPIFGYRFKSWNLVGWSLTMVCFAIMAFSSLGDPFCDRTNPAFAKYCGQPLQSVPQAAKDAAFNLHAPDKGALFIMLSMLVSIGYVMVSCVSDAMVVQYAQREPAAIRGRLQTAAYTIRTLTSMLAVCVTALGLNGKNYNGAFSFSMAPNVPYGVMLVPCACAVVATLVVVVEDKKPGTHIAVWVRRFWRLLQSRAMWQICAFRFINNVFNSVGATAGIPIQTYWAHVQPFNDSLSSLIGKATFATILAAVGRFGLHWNWRWIIAIGSIGVIFVDGIVMYLTIWDVVRNRWFFVGTGLTDNVPDGVRLIVATYCAVEIADPGIEGATYGLLTSINNLAAPLGSFLFKYIDSFFLVTVNDIKADTHQVRWDATYVYLISYSSRLFALVWLCLLPPQKKEMQALKKRGGQSTIAGAVLVFVLFGSLTFSMISSIMSIYPSTKCYRIAGGNGVLDPVTGNCPIPPPRK
ncbi:Aste57867_14067 [Aphanomyces stellatus]|uniref:Aste57867_14067 protein n=1 Tax=Aphanomyces stellatus TaxID=120398 RepID=A0A485KZR3_9STRA|nr:hypothetical protein As57867_014016 [Aphanomyces stellatus]VFT90895.1 Aste57867_14067 [Aphanomyces stellatus]